MILFPSKALVILVNLLVNLVSVMEPFSTETKGHTCGFTWDTIKVLTLNISAILCMGKSPATLPSMYFILVEGGL